mmetsp:Transcript_8048/g.18808  ORF Transcript_8048/g.18808 Transcript_8048/m.18808 type:complete len:217 (-) Transcript_8048:475-1125(-)
MRNPGENLKLLTMRIARKAFRADTNRKVTTSCELASVLAGAKLRVRSTRPPATRMKSNQFATSLTNLHLSVAIRIISSKRKMNTKMLSMTWKMGITCLKRSFGGRSPKSAAISRPSSSSWIMSKMEFSSTSAPAMVSRYFVTRSMHKRMGDLYFLNCCVDADSLRITFMVSFLHFVFRFFLFFFFFFLRELLALLISDPATDAASDSEPASDPASE